MESTAAIFTAAANARIMLVVPLASAATGLPGRFPWPPATSSVPMGVRSCLDEELVVFADRSGEPAQLALPSVLDDWLDDRASGCG